MVNLQLACTLTFEAIHNSSCDAGINHPNQYFSDSQKILQSKVDTPIWCLIHFIFVVWTDFQSKDSLWSEKYSSYNIRNFVDERL